MTVSCSIRRVVAVLVVALVAAPAPAAEGEANGDAKANWGQWRGPLGTGVSPGADPPVKWGEKQNVKWKVKLPGRGTSTPIVWGNKVFIQAAVPVEKKAVAANERPDEAAPVVLVQDRGPGGRRGPGGPGGPGGRGGGRGGFGGGQPPTEPHQFVLLCLDRATGKTLWQKVAREEVPHEGHHRDHGFASHSPVTDGKLVWSYFGSRGIHCFDMDGNVKWQKDLGRMQTKNSFGEGSSPALHGNTLVVLWDHEGPDFIAAFDATTGEEKWRTPREEDTTWATPLVVEHDGKAQVVVPATGRVRSYDLRTGEQVWETEGLTPNAIPSPVAADGMVYVMSGFKGSKLLAIKLGRTGDLTGTDSIAWTHNRQTPYVPSPLLYDHRLYFFASNNAMLSVFDARTGKPLVNGERIDGPEGVYASPVGAGGRVYLVGRNGTTAVIKHGDKLEELATNVLDERIDSSPAVAGKELFLRGQEHLYCIAAE
ncbi:MAG TPA: PQQ-binding-like beta-propeller repeat protein [Tepidisphaeraceae bacterium]|nr:PQQ-binding-like beta-propeller repeat protein [Tepidisphaeraceae bacterium]